MHFKSVESSTVIRPEYKVYLDTLQNTIDHITEMITKKYSKPEYCARWFHDPSKMHSMVHDEIYHATYPYSTEYANIYTIACKHVIKIKKEDVPPCLMNFLKLQK